MKNPIGNLNKVFDSRIRMGVMSILLMNAEVSFNDLKQLLELTDGNLASHLINLEENGFIKVHKGFIGRKTNTTYSITKAGEKSFKDHLQALENMIRGDWPRMIEPPRMTRSSTSLARTPPPVPIPIAV